MASIYKKIYETEDFYYFIRTSNKNKYYYRSKVKNGKIFNIEKISANEFWENFEVTKLNDNLEEKEVKKESSKEEIKPNDELDQEEKTKSFLDFTL